MAVTVARVRHLALALEGASEAPHFHRFAFRTKRKTFATLDEAVPDLNLMFNAELQEFYCEQEPASFSVLPGGWGRMGCTRCDLKIVDEPSLVSALEAAHRLALPRPAKRRK